MTPRLVRISLAVAASALVSGALAQTPPPTSPPPLPTVPSPNQPAGAQPGANPSVAAQPAPGQPGSLAATVAGSNDELVSLTLPDADLETVLSALEIYTGRIVLRPQALQTANYHLNFRKKQIPKSEAILAIETVLALNKIGIAPLGERFLKVVNLNEVKQEAPEYISGSAFDRAASGKVATKLFQLEFMRVQEFMQMVSTGILNPFYGAPVQLPNANAVVITDSISNLQRIEQLLQQVDKPVTVGMKPKFYPVRHSKASDLVNKLRNILTGTLQVQLGQATTYSADDRTNQIVLVTDPRQHAFFDELISRLDQRSDPNTRTEVLYLKHAKALDVVNVLSKIISGQTTAIQRQNPGAVRPGTIVPPGVPPPPQAPPQPATVSASASQNPNIDAIAGANEFSALMTVVNDERSNAVVVFGTADDIRLVKDLVDKLDIVLAQVRIEVVIAEVTLDDTDASGISSLGLRIEGDKLVGFSGVLAAPAGGSPHVSVTDGAIARVDGNWDLAATLAINSNLRKRNNSIVTVPAIITSHGKKAKIFNGETRPVVTGQIQSGVSGAGGLASSSTITQQEIGTTLTVTPFIGVDGSVQLELVQDVQDVTGRVQVDQNEQYIIGKRQTESYVTAKSGDIIVLGGFRKNSKINERGRLGPIPILGDIFGPRNRSNNRQELIFFLRPIVLTNNPNADNAPELKRIEEWTSRDAIKQELDPNFRPQQQPKSVLDKILPK